MPAKRSYRLTLTMKKSISLLLTTILFAGCSTEHQSGKPSLSVSILPLRPIVEGIVGNDFRIEVLVPAGASPETFEPTPKQFIGLNDARMIFNVGLIDFEQTLLSKTSDTTKIIALSRGIDPIEGDCVHDGHAHGIDPHIWTSPRELKKMAENAYEAIHRVFPDSAKYTANYETLQDNLARLDTEVAAKIARSDVRSFMVYHPALTYYARAYGLEQIAVEDEGKEPSAKRLSRIIARARAEGIKRIFYQVQFPASTVEVISRDIGGQSIGIDPLREDIFENITEITDLITTL